MALKSLTATAINKSFGVNQVLTDVNIEINCGAIHALVGENGAGKSTLMKILAGIHGYDSGSITFAGNALEIHCPRDAQRAGIMLMHQELSLFPEMSVAENIFSGHLPLKTLGIIDRQILYNRTAEILAQLECRFSPFEQVSKLSIGNQHICEFARFLSQSPQIIILDEPTASLTEHEKNLLFLTIRKLKEQHNLGILYISHRMHEIFEIADQVSVLRDGVMQGTFAIDEVDEEQLTHLMIGRNLESISRQNFVGTTVGDCLLRVENLSYPGVFKDISFTVAAGEIVGMAGLIGARRTEIADSIFGLLVPTTGDIYFKNEKIVSHSVKRSIARGIALVPDERKEQGLVLGMSCAENITLASLDKISKYGMISNSREKNIYQDYQKLLSIKSTAPTQPVSRLSGGNQQKIILAKWLLSHPSLLILNEPTRGIDVGSKAEIYKMMKKLISQGYGILIISSDIFELLNLSHRVIAVNNGRITAEFTDDEITEDNIIRSISCSSEEVKSVT